MHLITRKSSYPTRERDPDNICNGMNFVLLVPLSRCDSLKSYDLESEKRHRFVKQED